MSELSEETAAVLRSVLGAENAAVWMYGLTSAFASEGRISSAMTEAMNHHRTQRDALERTLRDGGLEPPQAQAAYAVPSPVTDQTSAITALITAERDCEIGWRAVLDTTDHPQLRRAALDGLTAAATRATRWRITAGTRPPALPFPGQP